MSLVVRKPFFAYAKTKTQISAFDFPTQIVQQSLLNPKFQASSYLLLLYSPACVRPGRKPRIPVFSQRGSYLVLSSVVLALDSMTALKY